MARYSINNQAFTEAYKKLNQEQKRAVDQIEGPVMVIAGPGTGKTQILSARIGKILMETDTQPGNILCLTYTDAGVIAMRKRLLEFIGPDAYKVHISTFHAFCNNVIQDNLSLFEKTSLDPVSELERIQLFKVLIDQFPKNHPLKRYRGDVYYEIGNLQHLFSTMKKENWSPGYINQKIDEYIDALPLQQDYICKRATKTFKKGDIRTDLIAEETEKMERLRAAVNEFEQYQQMMRAKSRYDFDDMINWVIDAFSSNTYLLTGYQERYHFLLVDEYQDTSGIQNQLVQMLINYWDKPNIFVVGDDDQSIYRFQGANVENMIEFAGKYANDLITVVLTSNYRSVQPILDISKTLIDTNQKRLVRELPNLSKDLISSNRLISHLTHRPRVKKYETQREEMIDITVQIEQLVQEGVNPERIAIIYRENKYGEELFDYLKRRRIPAYSKRSKNILQIPFARKVIKLLNYLAAEHDTPFGGDEMLFEILHFDFYGIPPVEIARMMVEANGLRQGGEATSLRKLVQQKIHQPPQTLFDTPVHPHLQKISNQLEALIAAVPNVTIQTLFEMVIRDGGVLEWVMNNERKVYLLHVLNGLFEFVKEETRRNPEIDLEELTATIRLMIDNRISVPLVETSGTAAGVNLLTAHGSKGLEYEYVFVAGCNASYWDDVKRGRSGYTFPDTMFSSHTSSSEEELRRLFYVALTRAEKYLTLSYAAHRADGREWEPSRFIHEIISKHALPIEGVSVPADLVSQFNEDQFTPRSPEIQKTDDDFMKGLVDRFEMNVTALNNFLRCPLEFYYKNLIRIPVGKSEALAFGSAVHYAVQRFFERMKTTADAHFPSQKVLLEDFTWYMQRHRENFTREAFARRMEYGEEVLKNYYDKYIGSWSNIVVVERNIRNVTVNGVPLRGKIDKIEFFGNEVNIVDYKSGDLEKAKDKLKPPDARQPNGGDYWRQAVFYKMLVDNYERNIWQTLSVEFDFLEPDKKGEYFKKKLFIHAADVETVTQQITTVWNRVRQHDFYTGCGKEDCHWCNFIKDNNLAVAWHELKEEEE
ncbi:MAG: ATP-dependent helicase [Williamsia sp.]|nr:ATP-dependent helicase [Williamsia sp.]